MKQLVLNIIRFYYEGFTSMTIGKKLWAIIFIKLIIMFFVLKLFFFKNHLNEKFENDMDKSEYVINQLTK